ATARPLLDRLAAGPLDLQEIARDARARRGAGPDAPDAAVLTAAAVLGDPKNAVVAGVRDEAGDLIGLLVAFDERPRRSFTPDEVVALGQIAGHVGVVIENSR